MSMCYKKLRDVDWQSWLLIKIVTTWILSLDYEDGLALKIDQRLVL